jgi:lysophospholipase L1-like esterase
MRASALAGALVLSAAFAGCGASAPESKAVVIAALGDSITAGSPLYDPRAGVRAGIGAESVDPRSQYEFWARQRLGGVEFRNCGVFGERTDQIARRLDRCAAGADVLIVQGGINDIGQGRSVSSAAAALEEMVHRGRRLGLRCVLAEVLPWTNGYPAAAPKIRELNGLIQAIGARERVPVLPWYRAIEDPHRPGRMRPALTHDGDHPNVAGYRVLGRLVVLPPSG